MKEFWFWFWWAFQWPIPYHSTYQLFFSRNPVVSILKTGPGQPAADQLWW
jgi:hypothetical protein